MNELYEDLKSARMQRSALKACIKRQKAMRRQLARIKKQNDRLAAKLHAEEAKYQPDHCVMYAKQSRY